ncbi:MAG: glycogen debranching protein GlgX [Alishewanella sp.]|nr:glycogen debranching protein GlgX [Alishewanella sp.]MDP5187824.1 glycogen debranching protein GlgX [Alishewanella sp.]
MTAVIGLLKMSAGQPSPLGASLVQAETWNFAVYAPDASELTLCLFLPDTEELLAEIPFQGRTGEIWHVAVSGIEQGSLYALKAAGPNIPDAGLRFDKERLLLDPYCRKLNRPQMWQERQYASHSHYSLAKGVLEQAPFDWQDSFKPAIPREKTVIYEAHVKGMTMQHPDVPEHLRGTYLGLCHPAIIEHLLALGITTVQLLPVASFMAEPRLSALRLTNYWGYNPLNFFAPEPRYQYEDAVAEFKTMVRTLHQHGLEVILDVVFNHTAEAGEDGPVLSFRGLANRQYYLFHSHGEMIDYQNYCNFTGCGNTLNVSHPMMQRMIMDALRYWLTEMQVDGFRFDLAVTLGREFKRYNPFAAFFQIVAQDPVISKAKLIAEPWDVGPFGYHLGQFPAHWSELNDKCRDTFRAFWRGDQGVLPEFATRLLGSRDIFQKHHKPASCSVNYISYHDGFTLRDLVSYNDKHNWLNGEENRDGHGHNLSKNHGAEGVTSDEAIINARNQHRRNLVATLVLSQGMIHWLGGDELSHTQHGNNNAYCQDNPISWLNWQLDGPATKFLKFVQQMLKMRQSLCCLQQISLLDDNYQKHGDKHHVHWYLMDGTDMSEPNWHESDRHSCMVDIVNDNSGQRLLCILNASDKNQAVSIPAPLRNLLFDTSVNDGLTPTTAVRKDKWLQSAYSLSVWQ